MKTNKDPRHLKRIRLLKALYSQKFSQTKPLPLIKAERMELADITKHLIKINEQINKFATKFPVEKMAKIDLSILQLGVYEIVYTKKTPVKVVVDECIELAKEFGAEKSFSLINGILGKLIETDHEKRSNSS